MTLTVGSLFSGIGGIDLGLERAGMEVRWQVESDAYCRRVLAKHWPAVPRFGDIKEADPSELAPVDVICGGFPCQPVSLAGKGCAQDDERWLWPEFVRIVRHLRPRYVLVENVPGLLVRGMGDVLGDLARLGYDAEWESLSAASVGAPHLRRRVFLVAYPCGEPVGLEQVGQLGSGGPHVAGHDGVNGPVADAPGGLLSDIEGFPAANGSQSLERPESGAGRRGDVGCAAEGVGLPRAAAPQVAEAVADPQRPGPQGHGHAGSQGRIVFASGGPPTGTWLPEPDVGRVAHGVPHRVDRLRALGNAVVPQISEWVGRQIVIADALRQAA
jgi:DNA (cytosine-5)-methyltransferase 1